jgi:hypothetical protein
MKKELILFYLDFLNNFLTIEKFAEYHGIEFDQCKKLLEIAKEIAEL